MRKGRILFICLLSGLMIVSISQSAIIKGKVTSVQGDAIELDAGSEKGIKLGDLGRVYYVVRIEGKERPIYVAKVKITRLTEKSSVGQVGEKTTDLRPGYLVEIISIREGELEIKSDPPGARVSVDAKDEGKTPLVLSRVKPGQHQIRVVHEGYEPHEEQVQVKDSQKARIVVALKKRVGELRVETEPPGGQVYLNGKSVEASPYEGKDLPPGPIKVRVMKEGYETWERDVKVEAGKRLEVLANMKEKKVVAPPPPLPPPTPPPPPIAKPAVSKEKEVTPEASPKISKKVDLSKKRVEAPVWKAGDKWIYKNSAGVFKHEVVEVKKDVYILRTARETLAYDRKTMNVVYGIGKDNKEDKRTEDPFRKYYDFPLSVGKKWNYITQTGSALKPGISYLSKFQVEGVEEVVTQAGTFMTFRVHYQQTNLSKQQRGWLRYWYSPSAKKEVKVEVEKTTYWADWLRDRELVFTN